jgi:hypothetical protein
VDKTHIRPEANRIRAWVFFPTRQVTKIKCIFCFEPNPHSFPLQSAAQPNKNHTHIYFLSHNPKSRYPILSSPRVTKQTSGSGRRGAERSRHLCTTARRLPLGLGGRRHGPWHHRPLSRVVPSIPPSSSLWTALRSTDAGGLELEEPDYRLPAVEDDAQTRSREAALPLRSSRCELVVFGL